MPCTPPPGGVEEEQRYISFYPEWHKALPEDRADEHLAQVLHPAIDVSADAVLVVGL